MRADFIAGNVRLRARRPQLLTADDYDRLAGLDLDRLLSELARTGYRPYLTQARAATTPAQARWELSLAVVARMRDLLRPLTGFYTGAAAEVVGVLLARYDLADLLTVLRAALGGHTADTVMPVLLRVGQVTDAAAAELLAAPEPAAVIDRALAHRLPDARTAARLPAAWQRYTLHRDPAELELDIARQAMTGWLELLNSVGPAADPVRVVIGDEADRGNLLAALREPGRAPAPDGLLPGGSLGVRAQWHLDGSVERTPAQLEWALENRLHELAAAGWLRGDPLSADVPVAYVAGVQAEARAVRLLALSGEHSAPPALAGIGGRDG